jgi:hypothetical protein
VAVVRAISGGVGDRAALFDDLVHGEVVAARMVASFELDRREETVLGGTIRRGRVANSSRAVVSY